jgi:hypothetical protein
MPVVIPKIRGGTMKNTLWNLIFGGPDKTVAVKGVPNPFLPKVIPNVFPKETVAPVFPKKVIASRFPKEECDDDTNES